MIPFFLYVTENFLCFYFPKTARRLVILREKSVCQNFTFCGAAASILFYYGRIILPLKHVFIIKRSILAYKYSGGKAFFSKNY